MQNQRFCHLRRTAGKALQPLILGIDFNANGFEGRDSQQRLGIVVSENDYTAGYFPMKYQWRISRFRGEFPGHCQFVAAMPLRLDSNGSQVFGRDERVGRASVHQEKPFPNGVPRPQDWKPRRSHEWQPKVFSFLRQYTLSQS